VGRFTAAGSLPGRPLGYALNRQGDFDAILNLGYDWRPFWLTRHLATPLFQPGEHGFGGPR